MKGNETSISEGTEALLTEFSRKNNLGVRVSRTPELVSLACMGHEARTKGVEWRIEIDSYHSLIIESEQFPDNLVGELVDLAEGLKRASVHRDKQPREVTYAGGLEGADESPPP